MIEASKFGRGWHNFSKHWIVPHLGLSSNKKELLSASFESSVISTLMLDMTCQEKRKSLNIQLWLIWTCTGRTSIGKIPSATHNLHLGRHFVYCICHPSKEYKLCKVAGHWEPVKPEFHILRKVIWFMLNEMETRKEKKIDKPSKMHFHWTQSKANVVRENWLTGHKSLVISSYEILYFWCITCKRVTINRKLHINCGSHCICIVLKGKATIVLQQPSLNSHNAYIEAQEISK